MNANFGLLDELPDAVRDKRAEAGDVRRTCPARSGHVAGGNNRSPPQASIPVACRPPDRPSSRDFLTHLEKERDVSPHTLAAYGRDLEEFTRFLASYYGGTDWTWQGVDRLAIRGFLGHLTRRGLGKRSVARALSAVRTFYRYLHLTDVVDVNPARAVGSPQRERYLADLSRSCAGDASVRGRRGRRGQRALRRGAQPRDARAVLLDGHAFVGAVWTQSTRSRSALAASQGAGEGAQGAHCAGRRSRDTRAAGVRRAP